MQVTIEQEHYRMDTIRRRREEIRSGQIKPIEGEKALSHVRKTILGGSHLQAMSSSQTSYMRT